MSKTLPTARLADVLLEATMHLRKLQELHKSLTLIIQDWGIQPPESALIELRHALDKAAVPMPVAIPEAVAYLRVSGKRLARARKAARLRIGAPATPNGDYIPNLPVEPVDSSLSSLDLGELERVLAGLHEEE